MNVYRYTDFRAFLNKYVELRKKKGKDLSFSKVAEALRMQKTYVYRVMKGTARFDSDQLFATCQYLGLTLEETDYLLLLLEWERCSNTARKKILLGRIHDQQAAQKDVRKHIEIKIVETSEESRYLDYYLDPLHKIVHMYLTIPRFKTNPRLIAPQLGIPASRIESSLKTMENMGIIRRQTPKGPVDVIIEHLHLPKDSPLYLPSEILERQDVLEHVKHLLPHQRVLLSWTFSANETTRKRMHEEFLIYLRKAEALIKASPSEEVYRVSFDLFPWGLSND